MGLWHKRGDMLGDYGEISNVMKTVEIDFFSGYTSNIIGSLSQSSWARLSLQNLKIISQMKRISCLMSADASN